MALNRRAGNRFEASIWPGFVDAMTALLLILFFVLSIFMIVQFALRETITSQDAELDDLTLQLSSLATALGLEQQRADNLQTNLTDTQESLANAQDQMAVQMSTILALTDKSNAQTDAIKGFEAQIAGLLLDKQNLETDNAEILSQKEATELALANARTEIDAQTEAARLAAAKREAMEALIADLEAKGELQAAKLTETELALSESERTRVLEAAAAATLRERLSVSGEELSAMTLAMEQQRKAAEETMALLLAAEAAKNATDEELANTKTTLDAQQRAAELDVAKREALEALVKDLQAKDELQSTALNDATSALSEAEKDKLVETAAAEALRQRLLEADTELSAMSLALEAKRKEAEETLTLLAAAEFARKQLEAGQNVGSDKDTLLAIANDMLAQEQALSAESQRKVALLSAQTEELRKQLNELQGLLDASLEADAAAEIQMQNLGQNLNAALARAAAEQRKRAELEERERKRLSEETKDLKKFKSEFFGSLRDIMEGKEGVRIEGDRFVFSSEVLFSAGSADLGARGQQEIAKVAQIIRQVADEIPPEIDWILRVDGHTDKVPLSAGRQFADNWELSQARALSVVRYLSNYLGIPQNRLAANGFGEFQPIDPSNTPEAYALNRRIELKFTER